MLTLQRGDYLEAMKTLLNAGYWMDGAYIAEQVLTSSELQAFIDQEYSIDRQPYELDESTCLLYTSPSPRDATLSRMPSSA